MSDKKYMTASEEILDIFVDNTDLFEDKEFAYICNIIAKNKKELDRQFINKEELKKILLDIKKEYSLYDVNSDYLVCEILMRLDL